MKRQSIRWAVVGLGNVTTARFAPALSRSSRSVLAGCVSRNTDTAKSFAAKYAGARVYESFEDLLADAAIDIVYLATPNSMHFAQTRQALQAGKNVLCEKPLALAVAEGREVVALAAQTNKTLRVAYQFRFEQLFERVRELVCAGAIGDLRIVRLFGCAAGARQIAGWRQDPSQGGILSDLAIHLLDLVVWITGLRFVDISARANPAEGTGLPAQTLAVLGTLGSHCQCLITASRETVQGQNSFSLEGTKATLSCAAWRGGSEFELRLADDTGQKVEKIAASAIFEREVEAFEEELLDGKTTQLATGSDGIRAIVLSEAVRTSTKGGGALVKIDWQ